MAASSRWPRIMPRRRRRAWFSLTSVAIASAAASASLVLAAPDDVGNRHAPASSAYNTEWSSLELGPDAALAKALLDARAALEHCMRARETPHCRRGSGPDVGASLERATLATATFGLRAAHADARHVDAVAQSHAAFRGLSNADALARQYARDLPEQERRDVLEALRNAVEECTLAIATSAEGAGDAAATEHGCEGAARRHERNVDDAAPPMLSLPKGSSHWVDARGVPTLVYGWSTAPVNYADTTITTGAGSSASSSGVVDGDGDQGVGSANASASVLASFGAQTEYNGRMVDVVVLPAALYSHTRKKNGKYPEWLLRGKVSLLVDVVERVVRSGKVAQVYLSHGRPSSGSSAAGHDSQAMPRWATEVAPELVERTGHFCSYDITHPIAHRVWSEVLAELVPQLGSRGLLESRGAVVFQLMNEPALFNAQDLLAFMRDLRSSVHTLAGEMGAPPPPCWAKAMNNGWTSPLSLGGAMAGSAPSQDGLPRVELARALDGHSQDSRLTPKRAGFGSSQLPEVSRLLPSNVYSLDWVDTLLTYDLTRAVNPAQPVVESELHSLSTASWRQAALPPTLVHATAQLLAVSGVASVQLWYWGRKTAALPTQTSTNTSTTDAVITHYAPDVDATQEFGGGNFAMSATTQPLLVDAYVRAGVLLNALVDDVVALSRAEPALYMLYPYEAGAQPPAEGDDAPDDPHDGAESPGSSQAAARTPNSSSVHFSDDEGLASDGTPLARELGELGAVYSIAAQLGGRVGFVVSADAVDALQAGSVLLLAPLQARRYCGGAKVEFESGSSEEDRIQHALAGAHARGVHVVCDYDFPYDVADTRALQTLHRRVGALLHDPRRPLLCVDALHEGALAFGVHCRAVEVPCAASDTARGTPTCYALSVVSMATRAIRVRVEHAADAGARVRVADSFTGAGSGPDSHNSTTLHLEPMGSRMLNVRIDL